LQVAPPLGFEVPAGGFSPGNILEGQRFTINDGAGSPVKTFEFTSDATVGMNNVPVNVANGSSAEQVAEAIVAAIRQTVNTGVLIGLTPRHVGGGVVQVVSTAGASATVVAPSPLTVLAFDGAALDGERVTDW